MTTDNRYYKAIAEKLTGETISGVHTNNYYLNKICTSLGYTYSGVTCNGTYIKDFARHFTKQTYTKIHFNNYYLKKLAENLTGETYSNHDDNYFLGIINDNIIAPTPTFTSVVVTSDKSILSYADSESAVLTAQLMNGDVSASVSGETVDFYKYVDGTNDVLLWSDVTDSNGEASYSYASTGVGDVGLYAKVRSLVSKTFIIRDRTFYDASSSAHLSKYSTNNSTMSYDSTEEAYYLKQNTSSNNFGLATLNNLNLSNNVKISADFKLINNGTSGSTDNQQCGFKFGSFVARIINAKTARVYRITFCNSNGSSDISYIDCNISENIYYTLELSVESNTATLTLKQGTTVIATVTGNVSSYISSSNAFSLIDGVASTPYVYVKNIEIQEL